MKIGENSDWRALLESKRKEFGLSPAAPSKAKSAGVSGGEANAKTAETKQARAVAADFSGTIEEQVNSLRERSADGLPVRELGNFIDVRA